MLQSQLFTKTRREDPKDEVARNAKLLIRAGFLYKEMAGVYSYLPLGLRVIEKINNIIRKEMNAIGGQEVLMSALQNPEVWKKTDRYDVDVAFKTELKSGGELPLGWTHEEDITNIMRDHISSYKDLPRYAYQIQTKFRNEERAKSGIMRGREFLMKDLYSFSADQAGLDEFYEKAKEAYQKIFAAVGLGELTYLTFASGGAFSKFSHEFQTLCEAGEDTIYVSRDKKIAVNSEVYTDEVLADLGLSRDELEEKRAIEIGNIFKLGTRFSNPLSLSYLDEKGESQPVVMGSYGIGPGRLMGTVVEVMADEQGIVWPEAIAPFDAHLVILGDTEGSLKDKALGLAEILEKTGREVLVDDRAVSAGEKFADADLIGIPWRIVVSEKRAAQNEIEIKNRRTGEVKIVPEDQLLAALSN